MADVTIPKPGAIYNEQMAQGSDDRWYHKENGYWVANDQTRITDASIIEELTKAANWNEHGNYTGSTEDLVTGDYYDDTEYKQKYYYNGTNVVRWEINTNVEL